MNPSLLNILVAAFVAISVGVWLKTGRHVLAGLPMVEPAVRRPVPWRAADVLLIVLVFVLMQSLLVGLAVKFGGDGLPAKTVRADNELGGAAEKNSGTTESSDTAKNDNTEKAVGASTLSIPVVAANLFGSLLVLALALSYLRTVDRATWRDLGFDSRFVLSDLWLGMRWFFGLAPIVYGIQAILVQWFPSKHPIIELVDHDQGRWPMVLAVATAVVVAPLFEEFLFRVLFQGWMEAAIWRRFMARLPHDVQPSQLATTESPTIVAPSRADVLVTEVSLGDGQVGNLPHVASTYSVAAPENPYRSPRPIASKEIPDDSPRVKAVPQPILPLVISATLFALLHANHGPDPVPLFVLALGLGYLYRQTHRILPSLMVHLLLNGCTMAMVIFSEH